MVWNNAPSKGDLQSYRFGISRVVSEVSGSTPVAVHGNDELILAGSDVEMFNFVFISVASSIARDHEWRGCMNMGSARQKDKIPVEVAELVHAHRNVH